MIVVRLPISWTSSIAMSSHVPVSMCVACQLGILGNLVLCRLMSCRPWGGHCVSDVWLCIGVWDWHPKPVVSLYPREAEWCHLDVSPALSWLVLSLLALELAWWLSRWCHWYGCDAVVWEHSCGRTVHAVHVQLLAFRIHTWAVHRLCNRVGEPLPPWWHPIASVRLLLLAVHGASHQSEEKMLQEVWLCSLTALARRNARWFAATGPSQAFCMCWTSAAGLAELDWLAHKASIDSSDPSSNDEMLSGRMDCWSWNVDAADAKKA